MDGREPYENPSPASSITRLGIVRFVISEDPRSPAAQDPAGIGDLPTLTDEEILPPTVEKPPLRDDAAPTPIYDDPLEPVPG